MSSAVALRPFDTFGSPQASTSTSAHPYGSFSGDLPSASSSTSGRRGKTNERSSAATSARKRAERFLHEKAPGVSTLVAGHPDGYSSERTNRLGIPKPSRHGKNSKRYSSNEITGLIPDEDDGTQLHDPEYQAIKLVERPPPPLPSSSSYANGDPSSSSSYRNPRSGTNGIDHQEYDDGSETTSIASSTEDEEEDGMEAFSPKNRAAHLAATAAGNNNLGFSSSSTTLNARKIKTRNLNEPSRSYRNYTHDSSRLHVPAASSSNITTSSGRLGQSLKSYASTHALGNTATSISTNHFLRPPSINTTSTGRSSSRRTFADGPATYLAPSITMPPINAPLGESRPEGYNPYTYIPTTAAPSEVLSHHHHLPFSHKSRHHHVDFGPSTTYTYDPNKQTEEIAPPIAWQSSFTPSADHPERHRTKIHDDKLSTNLKRSIQSVKLDISFGLMRLGKKK